jgi:hypothetical protein
MEQIKKLWNEHPVKRWFVVGLIAGWVIATYVI